MLSYRHGFHAGNHADVLKHIVQCLILRSLKKKEKPFCYIDTHSGAGAYSLESAWSNKTSEYQLGIAKVINNQKLQELIPDYYNVINDINDHTGELKNYPGSPYIAANLARENDELNLIELHPNEYENLKYNMHYIANAHVHHRNAVEGLNALLPPKIRRGLILIDPPYELATEYHDIVKLVKDGYKKFAQGIFAVWYPVLGKGNDQSYEFVRNFTKLNIPGTLHVQLKVAEQDTIMGMHGSGMIICNCPYTLMDELKEIVPILKKELGLDSEACYKLEYLVEPI